MRCWVFCDWWLVRGDACRALVRRFAAVERRPRRVAKRRKGSDGPFLRQRPLGTNRLVSYRPLARTGLARRERVRARDRGMNGSLVGISDMAPISPEPKSASAFIQHKNRTQLSKKSLWKLSIVETCQPFGRATLSWQK